MLKLLILSSVVILSACATSSGSYQSPVVQMRNISLNIVKIYSESVAQSLARMPKDEILESGKQSVASKLKDPLSAQFRNVRLVKYLDGAVICGQVNAKNSYGGYVGFTDFVGSAYSATLRDSSSKYLEVIQAANAGLDTACSGPEYK